MTEWRWLVLSGGFTGDGSEQHRLFRNDDGDRLAFFKSQAAAEEYVIMHKLGEYCMIAEVAVEVAPASELRYKNGTRISATLPR